jgi:ABC-type glycerol-3-phosphate transport system substrate-binding protein
LLSLSLAALLFLMAALAGPSRAQSEVILTLAMPDFQAEFFPEEALREFEAQNPGLKVVIKETPATAFFTPPQSDLAAHFDDAAAYAAEGDVVLMPSDSLSLEAARAGYWLDLRPLTSIDPSLNEADFYYPMWQSVQWDNGVWALPLGGNLIFLTYLPSAFDAAGLAYPNEAWTIADYVNAAEVLTEKNAAGEVTRPALLTNLQNNGNGLFLYSFLGQGVYDYAAFPTAPNFQNPALVDLAQQWTEMGDFIVNGTTGGLDFREVPMLLSSQFDLLPFASEEARQPAYLPNNYTGLFMTYAAVSAGTDYPEQAYALAKFLTTRPDVVNNLFTPIPARQSLLGQETEGALDFGGDLSEANQAFVDNAIWTAIPASELRFMNYVEEALGRIVNEDIDPLIALQEAEIEALNHLQTADSGKPDLVLSVATPVPTPVLTTGEVALNFGVVSFTNPLPNLEAWQGAIADFTAADPQVAQINLDTTFEIQPAVLSETYDCYYLNYNPTQGDDLSMFLSLDPLMDADPSFNRADVLGNTLSLLQKNGKTWGFPLTLQPQILQYHSEFFAQAGLIPPDQGWTVDGFGDALQQLKPSPDDPAPFVPQSIGTTNLLMLMAAYGALPLDYRTTPPTVAFNDPANLEGIRQVLDLSKNGYIEYQELSSFGNFVIGGQEANTARIQDIALNGGLFGAGFDPLNSEGSPYRLTTYPRGNQYTAISFDIGGGYISASSSSGEACYRWLSFLSQRPDLFDQMPPRQSQIDQLAAQGALAPDVLSFYQTFAGLLQDPTTVFFPSIFAGLSSPSTFLSSYWLGVAFDNYVLREADLAAELDNAQVLTQGFLECSVNIPPYDALTFPDLNDYFQLFANCAIKIDPSLAALLGTGE